MQLIASLDNYEQFRNTGWGYFKVSHRYYEDYSK